jgi:hypothetical protein
VTALQVDTDASRTAARVWTEYADRINAAQMRVGSEVESLWLGNMAAFACSRLAAAATELWTLSGFLRLLVDQVEAVDSDSAQIRAGAVDELMWLAAGCRGSFVACPADTYSDVAGERGETFESELRAPSDIEADDPSELGRQLVLRALHDTAAPGQIRKDEFELVRLTDGRYLLALPGVIDLSHFAFGLDGDNRSVRDLDRSAAQSSMSTSVSDNAYAQMVWDALSVTGVPTGSDIVIVGHSFGADTALDLAADPHFNGSGGYNVTHVVAAGYDSQAQLDAVPPSTQVLVLQNRRDVPVLAETLGHSGVIEAIDDGVGVAKSVIRADPAGVVEAGVGFLWNAGKAGTSGVAHVAGRVDDVAEEIVHLDPVDAVEDMALPLTGSRQNDSQVVAVFDTGWEWSDAGHDQARYVDFLEATSDPLVLGFLGTLATGTTVAGTAVAVDVSVPEKKRDAQKT